MEDITLLLAILIIGFSVLLFIISTFSYYRTRSLKLLFVCIAFLTFTIKGLLTIIGIISQGNFALSLDFIILLLLYFAVIKT